jgi:hypothetical protein
MGAMTGNDDVGNTKRSGSPLFKWAERVFVALPSSICIMLLATSAASGQSLDLPPRSADALSGSEFAARVAAKELPEREEAAFKEITSGNVPNFLRKLCPVSVTNVAGSNTNKATFYVTADYLAIGSDDDYFLMPISPNTGQRIADALQCLLPTPKIVDAIYSAAEVKLAPAPIPLSPAMTTVPMFSNHNAMVRQQRAETLTAHPLGMLVAGHQKDVVISAKLASAPGKVAIYGWHKTNGVPIQPLYLKHVAGWVDYSQCTRLVQEAMLVNGERKSMTEALADPQLAGLLSDEGPIPNPRYPTNALAALPTTTNTTASAGFTGWQNVPKLNERVTSFTLDPEVKIHINAPAEKELPDRNEATKSSMGRRRKVQLIFYGLPNGNTTEQTIGKVLNPGDDWHFNIQHIGAQTRFLRELLKDRSVVVVYLENNLRSWPAWRKKYGDKGIISIIADVRRIFAGEEVEIVLSGHSGGGSLIFGYLNAVSEIPDEVVRIAFLDSNYAYDPAIGHKDKLVKWLSGSDHHFLCVLAYNDAAALLDGKTFVSAAGGTWGKSHAMQHDLADDFKFTSQTNADFKRFSTLDGRVQFILKENPEKKIFHTTQVELNGFIHCMVSGTTNESKGYEYFGPRAYSEWVR